MRRKKKVFLLITILLAAALLAGCGNAAPSASSAGNSNTKNNENARKIRGLTYQSEVKRDYADQFRIYRYQGGYRLITVADGSRYLVVPKGKKVPAGTGGKTVILRQPLSHVYNAATASMSLFSAAGALDQVTMSSLRESGWTFSAPRQRMQSGAMVYAGKYSEPDYEMLVDRRCDLAVESTMIYHTPDVKEMIEDLHIPVFVDRSSYEKHPLGRVEWVKVYGALTGRESAANRFFQGQKSKAAGRKTGGVSQGKKGKKVAFFYLSTDGKAVVRREDDYVPAMIRMAGGKYAYSGVQARASSVPMSMENFYELTRDADLIVYNGSIDRTVRSLADLKAKDPIMKKIPAVRQGNCYVAGSAMYQRTDLTGEMIADFRNLLAGDTGDLRFMKKLK